MANPDPESRTQPSSIGEEWNRRRGDHGARHRVDDVDVD
jgi:hypothetical protein